MGRGRGLIRGTGLPLSPNVPAAFRARFNFGFRYHQTFLQLRSKRCGDAALRHRSFQAPAFLIGDSALRKDENYAGADCQRPRSLELIARYTRPEMGRVWSEENKFQKWLEVELAATETLAEAGIVPREAAVKLREARPRRCGPHQRNRGQGPPRRDRLHHRGAGNGGRSRSRALAALRAYLQRCGRHRAGAADSRRLAADREGHRDAGRSARSAAPGNSRTRPKSAARTASTPSRSPSA